MLKVFKSNKNCPFICLVLLVFSIGFLNAQDQKKVSDIEKVYLHTDKSLYFVGDDLFYKAYNVRATNNVLFDNSTILYVELISPDQEILARNKTNLQIGLGHGDFQLTDSLGVKPGVYQLRAYTNWNRNFGEDFVFKKNIEVVDVFESNSKDNKTPITVTETKGKTKPQAQAIVERKIKVDFFPESGSLLTNVASIVGFKAVDSNGKPIPITGEIFDGNNEVVGSFSSVHDGMGKFQMIPMDAQNYYAKIKTEDGTELREELPKVTNQGYLLNYRVVRGKNIVSVLTNEATLLQNPNAIITVVCKSKGVSYLENTLTITQTASSFELDKNSTPEGISQITLIDNNSKPQSERLIYIEKEQDLDIQLATDKSTYKPNEKATVTFSSKTKTGSAKSGSFSMSVTDMNGVEENKDFGTNISSNFLLEADIRGEIHNPAYYFDATNLKRLDHLDNLLLTQGWRDFLWKTMPKASDTKNYIAEKGINISGKVKQLFGDKTKENYTIGLVLLNSKHINTFKTTTDSIGEFKFENLKFSEKMQMTVSSKDEKGKYKGEILLNPIEQPAIAVDFKKQTIDWNPTNRLIVDNVFKKYTTFGVKPENVLQEVSIVAKKNNKLVGAYGIPENTYVADESLKTFTSIFELIEQKIPGVIIENESIRFIRFQGSALILIDNMIDNTGLLNFILPQDVLKIESVRGSQAATFYGEQAASGIISIFTKPNKTIKEKSGFNYIKQDIEGFQTARVFYAPKNEQELLTLDIKETVRNTLYWNPYVHPDKDGNATVNYFNTKVETKVKIALEGITSNGIPVVRNSYYTINK
ncbi:hypothetical protein AAGV28_08450 [Flavobacterium sp. FZUC8N2.13]|uniref:TonB-dependent receptor plug domain-containing protein n=1 Tax=Flavobacterium zubiriense TaxID=3138075 RepID=A0ABV4TBC7_9FLAO